MATKKAPAIPSTIASVQKTFHEDDLVRLDVYYRTTHYRFLFDGGATVDVMAINDGSDLRRAVLEATGYPGIVGVAIVEDDSERT